MTYPPQPGQPELTGFWVPSFFLGSKSDSRAQGAAQQLVDAVNQHDKTKLGALKCPNATPAVQEIIDVVEGSIDDVQPAVTKAAAGANLSIDSLPGYGDITIGTLTGTVGGETITIGSIGTNDAPGAGACIDLFNVN